MHLANQAQAAESYECRIALCGEGKGKRQHPACTAHDRHLRRLYSVLLEKQPYPRYETLGFILRNPMDPNYAHRIPRREKIKREGASHPFRLVPPDRECRFPNRVFSITERMNANHRFV